MSDPELPSGGEELTLPVRVLFVCMGNICRSPTAQGVFEAQVHEAGLDGRVVADSAGLGPWHVGEAPDPRAQNAAWNRGIDLSGQRARQVEQTDFDRFHYMLAMDRGNLVALQQRQPTGSAVLIELLMRHAPGGYGREVGDPYAGGPAGFEQVLDQVEVACRGLLQTLSVRHKLSRR